MTGGAFECHDGLVLEFNEVFRKFAQPRQSGPNGAQSGFNLSRLSPLKERLRDASTDRGVAQVRVDQVPKLVGQIGSGSSRKVAVASFVPHLHEGRPTDASQNPGSRAGMSRVGGCWVVEGTGKYSSRLGRSASSADVRCITGAFQWCY